MPQQLIYTSAPRGLVAGRSGHCTVARSVSMRDALVLQLERFSYYQHLSLSGGQDRPIFACRLVDIRGARFHVLSRIDDAGLDFTGRTNFIAHHLIFTSEEIQEQATPPVVLHHWPGWIKSWTREPEIFENEDWSSLAALANTTSVPAQTWQRLAGDAVNAAGLLEARAGSSFRVDGISDDDLLQLFAEALELLSVREQKINFRVAAWNYTFTTSLQEQDNPADFRWRCFHSDNPAASRFATPDSRALIDVRPATWTDEEALLARSGRQPPRFVVEPQDTRIMEREMARFAALAEGVPAPAYQWFSVDRANHAKILPAETHPQLVVANPVLGISRYRVDATNSSGSTQSRIVTLSVEQKSTSPELRTRPSSSSPAASSTYTVKSADDIERDRERHRLKNEEETIRKKQWWNKMLLFAIAALALAVMGIFAFKQHFSVKTKSPAAVSAAPPKEIQVHSPVAVKPVSQPVPPPVTNQYKPSPQLFGGQPMRTTNAPSRGKIYAGGWNTNPSSGK